MTSFRLYGYDIVNVHGTEALCMFWKCFNGPCCDLDKISCFAQGFPQICHYKHDDLSYI